MSTTIERTGGRERWVDIKALSELENLGVSTLRRYVRRRLITHRRRGLGNRTELQFPLPKVSEQLRKLLETRGIAVAGDEPENPMMFTLLDEIRQLRGQIERLEAAVKSIL